MALGIIWASSTAISIDKNIHAVIVTGAGKGFCAGGDLKEIWEARQKNDKDSLEPLLRSGMGAVLKIRVRWHGSR